MVVRDYVMSENSTVLKLNSCSAVLHRAGLKVQPMDVAGQWRKTVAESEGDTYASGGILEFVIHHTKRKETKLK